ncbi:alpha/beta hydrolase [Fructobacillus ficulneus]|uniref:Cell surface hydrolase n=1 Tax=Fructobacillus ficulneus TaxID=157463 RepID=A0A0K8MJC1_9LACO|nr:alpha/beta hydrolase [Fructobacillus ficulneus]GAP00289.1 cell surface hydrolase [Fructobacillus ficulneus]
MKKKLAFGASFLIVVGVLIYLGTGSKMTHTLSEQNGKMPTEATVFIHGYGSSRNAEKSMAQSLVAKGYSNTKINVTVAKNGTVTMNKTIGPGDKRPLILVQFDDNTNQNFMQSAGWLDTVMTKLSQQGIRSVNLVGHSMGNQAIAYYLMDKANKGTDLPKVKKQISLAGTYNGLILADPQSNAALNDQGEPQVKTKTFTNLQNLTTYYQNHATQVLNIFGNSTGGSQSDQVVYNNSSQSLKYFVRQPSTYQEQLITGPTGQHSQLHENSVVDEAIYQFLTK